MNETKEIDTIIGNRLKLFLNALPISIRGFSTITRISQSTLSRIINGATNFGHDKILIIAESFGVSELDFQNPKVPIPDRKTLIINLKKYVSINEIDININLLLQGDKTAHHVDAFINDGKLDQFQSIKEIRNGIKDEYGVNLRGADITNILGRRLGKLIERKDGTKIGTFEYRRIKNS